MKYEVTATYMVRKIMHVTVAEGEDPSDPAKWEDAEDYLDSDCQLDEVIGYVELE